MDDCINTKNRIVMKELQLIDRVVVEIRGEEGTSERLSLVHIANELRKVAEQIENGMKGDEWVEEDMRTHEHREVLFEHECTEFGFRMGNKSLICQYYYGSEKKPKSISDELIDSIIEFNKDYDEQSEKIGEDIYTKTDFLEDAARLLSRVEQENK